MNMLEKLIEILKKEPFYVPDTLLKNYRNLNITDSELIVLIYLLNSDSCFNPKQIAKDLNFKLDEVMNIINSLVEKTILKIDVVNKKVREEIINLEELYKKLAFAIINNETKNQKKNLFDVFEKEFGRTLSPMDYEIISEWQKDFSDELILLALKEAVFNGVNNLRYIDKIIHDWHKKGLKMNKILLMIERNFKIRNRTKNCSIMIG